MATPNAELLQQVLAEVECGYSGDLTRIARRDAEDRDGWRLIAYGVEGHAIALSHPEAVWHWQPDPDQDGAELAVLVSVDGSRKKPGRSALFVARKLLGLDREQADRLFGAETIDEVRRIVGELCAGAS
jgi:hypothetical protein